MSAIKTANQFVNPSSPSFWLAIVPVIIGAAMHSGLIPDTGITQKIAAFILEITGPAGYFLHRNAVKTALYMPSPDTLEKMDAVKL